MMTMDLFKITGCLNRSKNDGFGESLLCTAGWSSALRSNTSTMSFFDMSTPFARHTFRSISTACSCLPLVSSHLTDSGINLENYHYRYYYYRYWLSASSDVRTRVPSYHWPLVCRIAQGRYGNGQLKVSPIVEGVRKSRRQKETDGKEHLYDDTDHHPIAGTNEFQTLKKNKTGIPNIIMSNIRRFFAE